MIKKIICPLDFSEAAVNAATYAARLAQVFKAELRLVNVHEFESAPMAWTVFEANDAIGLERRLETKELLKDTAKKLSGRYEIICNSEIIEKKNSLADTISAQDNENTLIVMGTNGADGLYELIFGTNTYRVIEKTACPVLVVPMFCRYKAYKQVLFTYNEKDNLRLKFFNEFVSPFHSEVEFLEICPSELEEEEKFTLDKSDELNKLSGKKISVEGKIYDQYSSEVIEEFIADHPADLLALQARETESDNTFHRKLVKGICETASYPVLVLH